jgi:hypothetical protein
MKPVSHFSWPLRIAVLGTLALLVSALFPHTELRLINPGSSTDPEFDLVQGWAYLVLAPVCTVIDMLTLLSPWQHFQLWVGIAAIWVAGRWAARLTGRVTGPVDRARARRHFLATVFAGFAIYAVGFLAPRPTESLVVSAPDLVKVDFHSHTQFSHDGRPYFNAEASRDWHREAGFDAAYISDHNDWKGVDEGLKNNPALAGQGTVLLEAREFWLGAAHVIGLGDRELYQFALKDDHFDAAKATKRYAATGVWPVMIFTMPGVVTDLEDYANTGLAPYSALEINDGAPRGLEQGWRDRNWLQRLSQKYDLSLVTSSNNHGWGRTAPAWTLIPIPGWRKMTPAELSTACLRQLADRGRDATYVVERLPPAPAGAWYAPVLLVPTLASFLLTTLTTPERLVWLLYLWIGAAPFAPELRTIPWRTGAMAR